MVYLFHNILEQNMATLYDSIKKYLSTCKSVNYLYFPDSVRPGYRDFLQYDMPTTYGQMRDPQDTG